jgi:AsmA protein
MRKWIIGGAFAIILLIVVAVALVLNVNALIARNKDYLISQAEQALGRDISVGEVEATLLSGIGVRLSNFAMADDPAFSSDEFVRAKDLQVNLRFWPLLRKEFEVKRVILHDPTIRVIRNKAGVFNFSTIGKDKDKKAAEKEKKERAPKEDVPPALLVSLIDISGGDVRYIDRKDGSDLHVQQIDLKVTDLDFNQPFSVRLAAAVYADKQNLNLTGKFGPLQRNSDPNQVPMDVQVDIDRLDMTRLKKAAPNLKNVFPKELDLSGVFRVKDLRFKGTLKDLALSGAIEGTDGAIRYGASFQKPAGIPLTLSTDARYGGDRVAIRKGSLKLHTLELASAGDVQLGASPVVNLSVDSKPASLEGWDEIVPAIARYQLAGTMEITATVRGKLGNGAAPQVQGVLTLKNASAKPPDFPKPIENLDTTVKFTGQRADIDEMTLSLGKSRIRVAAAVEQFAPLTLSYKLATPELWPADYTTALSEERKADVIRNLRSEGQLTVADGHPVYRGKLNSADGTLYNVGYKNLDAALSLANNVATIQSLRVNALSGALQVQGEYAFKDPTPRFSVASQAQGINVKELYTALDAKAEHDIRGRLNADMKLSGSGKNWEEIKPNLRGQGEAEVLQGAVHNFNLAESVLTGITGVPGLTNVVISPSLRKKYPETFTAKDTEFKELKTLLDVGGGRIDVKSLRMAAAEFFVQGNGWVDFNRRVDIRATLQFSQRLSADLSQSVREIKYLLSNQGQLEIPFTLSGTLPNVKPKPDVNFLGQMVQRNFMRRGVDELQNRFLGGKDRTEDAKSVPDEGKKNRGNSTEDLIRRGLEGLFKR